MEPLDLAGGRRAPGRRQQVVDAVLPADPVEQDLGVGAPEPAGEHLAVIGQDLLRHAVAAHRLGEVRAHGPARCPQHQPGADHEPGVVIDPGEDLGLPPVGQQDPADDVHLPQLHRSAALPALEAPVTAAPGQRVDQPGPLQRPVDPRARGHRVHAGPGGLVHEPTGTPVRVATTRLEHPDLDGGIHLVRAPAGTVGTIGQSRQTLGLVPAEPPMDRLARHVEPVRHLHDRNAIADHREHCLVPLLHDTQLHQHVGECHGSGGASVTHQPEPRNPSAGAEMSRVRRNHTISVVGPPGLEPGTCGLRVRCSARLS